MYATWKLKELKDELKRRGAKVTGKKTDLVKRLEFYDQNIQCADQSPQGSQLGQYNMDVPAAETFRDVNSSVNLPKITKQHIQSYFSRFNKNIGDAKKLYESRYLHVLRSSQQGLDTFLKGYCKASMKQLQYEVNVKITQEGMPEEANCECAAGQGPEAHCKHIAVVLLGAENMAQQKMILLREVSTSKLQTFHQPAKKYYATPLRASGLPSKRDIAKTVFSPYLRNHQNFDKEAYKSRFQSLILNFPASMPLRQIYPPANKQAIGLDHDYREKSSIDEFLEIMYLENISQEKILEIETNTRGQSTNKMWHVLRKSHITASIFHTVCHLKDETKEKYAQQILNKTNIRTKAMTHGLINEKVAINKYIEMYKLEVVECGLFLSKERPYLGASPDGLLGLDTIIEVKCPYASRYSNITPETVPYLKYDENGQLTLKTKNIYYYQVQGQLYVTERRYCNFIVFTFKDMKVLFIDRDDTFIEEMVQKVDFFYNRFFKTAVINKYFYKDYDSIFKDC